MKSTQFSIFVVTCLLIPTLAIGANYVPLPDMVPADDGMASQESAKPIKQINIKRKKKTYEDEKIIEPFAQEIQLFAGETRVLKEPNAGRLAVGNGKVLSAAVLDDKEILLIANKLGISSLHIWTKNGKNRRIKVTVVPNETERVSREIAAFLTSIPNAKASVVGDKVVVEGDNMTDANLEKVEILAKQYPQIINFTNQVGWEKMIAMDVRVVEFPTKYLREVGIKWGATGGGAVGALMSLGRRGDQAGIQINQVSRPDAQAPITGIGGGAFPIPSSLNIVSVLNAGFNAQLNLMEQDGTATILARPTLSTRSGTKAEFLAGGEIPYAVSNINGTTILFKQYGIKLEVEPRVDPNGIIRAKILSEVSEIDTAQSGTLGGPALLTRKTQSEFNVQQGETIVLSGLLKKNKSTTIDKLPFLGDIPVLGALFRSKRFQNDETELVVFVTPVATDKHTGAQQIEMENAEQRMSDDLSSKANSDQDKTDTYPVVVPDKESNEGAIGPTALLAPNTAYANEK